MKKMKLIIAVGIISFLAMTSCKDESPAVTIDCNTVKFSTVMAPLVESKCATSGCHNAGSANGDFTTYDLFKPFLDDNRVRTEVLVDKTMPAGGVTLSETQLAQFTCWLDDGHPNN